MSVYFVNSYLDFEDYDKPIKQYIEDRYTYRALPTYKKLIKMYIKENYVELSDNILGIGQSEEQKFLSVDNQIQDLHPSAVAAREVYFEILLTLDPQKDYYTRTVFSFLDLFGQLGGVFELMCIWMGLIVWFFAKNVMFFSIFKRLYHIEREEDNNHQESADEHKDENNNGATTAKTHNNLLTNSRNEEQKVIPDNNPLNTLNGQNLMKKRMHTNDVNLYPDFKQKATDESWAFDRVEQTSAIGMNLQDNYGNSVAMHGNLKKENPIQNLK